MRESPCISEYREVKIFECGQSAGKAGGEQWQNFCSQTVSKCSSCKTIAKDTVTSTRIPRDHTPDSIVIWEKIWSTPYGDIGTNVNYNGPKVAKFLVG